MQYKSLLAGISLAVAMGMASAAPAEAGGCRGWCGSRTVNHYVYYPWFQNNVYYMATFGGDPYPYVYVPRGYWPRYRRPYGRYARRYWAPRWGRGCCGGTAYYAVPAPTPVPVGRCRGGCGREYDYGYLK